MTAETDQPKTELPAELKGADEAVVTFHPQVWKNDYPITGDDTETYTVPLEEVLTDDGELPETNEETERLAWCENAPERAQNWYGPYYVTIDEVQ